MVPKLEDDFVLTIEDEDEDLPDYEEEDLLKSTEKPSKKRKRGNEAELRLSGKKVKVKKSKNYHKEETEDEDETEEPEGQTWADHGEDDGAIASDFEFAAGDIDTGVVDGFDGWGLNKEKAHEQQKVNGKGVDIDEIIARRRNQTETDDASSQTKGEVAGDVSEEEITFAGFDDEDELLAEDGFGMGVVESEEEKESEGSNDASDGADEENDSSSDDDIVAKPVPHPDDLVASQSEEEDEEREDPAEAERRAAFFAPEENVDGNHPPTKSGQDSFQHLSLSRPILKGLASVGFTAPTPIQAKSIPVALRGVDIVGGAETGSGKTGAFIVPILERLLYRPKKVPTTRVVILMPTRELAVQCFNVARKLAAYTDITFALIVGGLSLREQETVLKTRPDVVIATPGRFIDHFRNSAFAVDAIEILVLDEADRMLEEGFADELNEILNTIPKSRQTMLFSATMTDSVDKLIRVGLKRPVRLMVNAKRQTVKGLVQEFVRLRPGKEDKRLAYLLYLAKNVYLNRTIIFFRQKKEAHRIRVVFGLCGLKAVELHGSMSQEQRIQAVEAFRNGIASFLLATDLASRGLDIKGVDTVINYEAPQTHDIYLHRVGRTARAGRSGRACTLASEPDRKVVKAAVKVAREQGAKIASRVIPADEGDKWAARLDDLEDDIEAVLKEEKEEKALGSVERDLRRGENLVKHEAEIYARPKRTWFESEKDKKAAKEAGLRELNGEIPGAKKEKRKLSNKEKKKLDARDFRKSIEGMGWKKRKTDASQATPKGKKGQKGKGKPKTGGKSKHRK